MSKAKHQFDPCLLISMPQMQDPNFLQTVSVLSEFNENGAVALIINRPLKITLYDVLSPDFRKQFDVDSKMKKTLRSNPVFWGGPIDLQQGLILHTCKDYKNESVTIHDTMFITGSITILKELLKRKTLEDEDVHFRFMLGYAGWEAQQLEHEMSESSWITSKLDPSILQTKPEDLWVDSVKKLGVEVSQLTSVHQEQFH